MGRSEFLDARVSAKIDRLDFAWLIGEAIPEGLDGRLNFFKAGFAIHDPQPADLRKLCRFPLVGMEVAVDSRPKSSIRGADRRMHFHEIYSFLAARHWPFDAPGVRPHFRVTGTDTRDGYPETRISGFRRADHEKDGAILETVRQSQPTLPWFSSEYRKSATRYMGDKAGYTSPNADWNQLPNYAEVKQYFKDFDNSQALPPEAHRVRLEVTLSSEGLRSIGVSTTSDLIDLNFRPVLAPYFRIISPDKIRRPIRRRSGAASDLSSRALESAWKSLIDQTVEAHGVAGLLHMHHPKPRPRRTPTTEPLTWVKTARPDGDSRDEAANRKIGVALGNLSRSLRSV